MSNKQLASRLMFIGGMAELGYWFVIYLGSSYIRTLMLKAIKRRAERG